MKIDDFTKDEIISYLRKRLFFTRDGEKGVVRELCFIRYERVSEKCLKEMDAVINRRKTIPIEDRKKWLRSVEDFNKAKSEFDKNEKWHDKVMKELL